MYLWDIILLEDLRKPCPSSLKTITQVNSFWKYSNWKENGNFEHWCKSLGGKFTRFNYGAEGNVEHYGTETAPEYNLKLVTAPVYLFYGVTDGVATPEVGSLSFDMLITFLEKKNNDVILNVLITVDNIWNILWRCIGCKLAVVQSG